MSEQKRRKVGPRMIQAQAYVSDNPGCTKYEAARAVSPNGSANYGYQIINRALRLGLIVNHGETYHGALYVAPDSKGDNMTRTVAHVTANPGCTQYVAAKAVSPDGTAVTGWEIIAQALREGWIVDRGRKYMSALYPVTTGRPGKTG